MQMLPGRIWDFAKQLPGQIWTAIKGGASWLTDGAVAIGEAVWQKTKDALEFIMELPKKIRDALGGLGVNIIGNILSGGGDGGPLAGAIDFGQGLVRAPLRRARNVATGTVGQNGIGEQSQRGRPAAVEIGIQQNGLGQLFTLEERDSNIDT
jgi:hypothetical protein